MEFPVDRTQAMRKKKVYAAPSLTVFGDIRQITMNKFAVAGNKDGGGGFACKTGGMA